MNPGKTQEAVKNHGNVLEKRAFATFRKLKCMTTCERTVKKPYCSLIKGAIDNSKPNCC